MKKKSPGPQKGAKAGKATPDGSLGTRAREPKPPRALKAKGKARPVRETVNIGISSKRPELPPWTGEPKFTAELRSKIVDVVRRGNFRETACATVGVSPRTLRIWLSRAKDVREMPANHHAAHEDYLQFERDLEQAEAESEDLIVVGLQQAAAKDWRAAAWYLEHRASKRWGYKAQVEFTIDEALEAVLDDCANLFGPEAAVKLFGAIASRRDRGTETRGADRAARVGEGGEGPSRGGSPVH